jgi:hypothetical protein
MRAWRCVILRGYGMIETRILHDGDGYRDGRVRVEIDLPAVEVASTGRAVIAVFLLGLCMVVLTLIGLRSGVLAAASMCGAFALIAYRLWPIVRLSAPASLPRRTIRLDESLAVSHGGAFTEIASIAQIDDVIVESRVANKRDVRVRVGDVHHTLGADLEMEDAEALAREILEHVARSR